jgi:hypothetical protein
MHKSAINGAMKMRVSRTSIFPGTTSASPAVENMSVFKPSSIANICVHSASTLGPTSLARGSGLVESTSALDLFAIPRRESIQSDVTLSLCQCNKSPLYGAKSAQLRASNAEALPLLVKNCCTSPSISPVLSGAKNTTVGVDQDIEMAAVSSAVQPMKMELS